MAGKQLHKSITRGRCVHDTACFIRGETSASIFAATGFHMLLFLFFPFHFFGIMVLSRKFQNLIRREEEEEQEGGEASEKKKVDVVEAGAKEEKKTFFGFSVTSRKSL